MRRMGLSATLLALGAVLATAQSYRVRELKPLPNHVGSVALGVAENGDAAGYSVAANGAHRATLWRQGQAIDVGDIQGFESSEAVGLTSSGNYGVRATRDHIPISAIRYNGETRLYPEMTLNDVSETNYFAGEQPMEPGLFDNIFPSLLHGHQSVLIKAFLTAIRQSVFGVSDTGESAGLWVPINQPSVFVGMYWWQTFPSGASGSRILYDRNDSNVAVGQSSDGNSAVIHTAYYGQSTPLARIDGYALQAAKSINNSNLIVGRAWNEGGASEAAIWTSYNSVSRLIDHVQNPEGWALAEATRLSHSGFIVGTGTWNGLQRAYIAAPVPEPATLLGFVFGFGMAAFARRKRCNHRRVA